MFNKFLSIYKKELGSYFNSLIAYVFLVLFIVIPGFFFFFFLGGIFKEDMASMRVYFMILPYVFIIFIPGLTMGSWAKENNDGTVELLFTLPVSEWVVIMGKFLAALTLVCIALGSTIITPILVHIFMGNFDIGQLITQYFGAILMACTYIAITFFISSLFKELIISFLLSSVVLFLLAISGYITNASVLSFPDWMGFFKIFLNEISLSTHFANFSKGVIHSKDIIYYLGLALLFFYFNLKSLESRKWR